jgi:hypothetical protein
VPPCRSKTVQCVLDISPAWFAFAMLRWELSRRDRSRPGHAVANTHLPVRTNAVVVKANALPYKVQSLATDTGVGRRTQSGVQSVWTMFPGLRRLSDHTGLPDSGQFGLLPWRHRDTSACTTFDCMRLRSATSRAHIEPGTDAARERDARRCVPRAFQPLPIWPRRPYDVVRVVLIRTSGVSRHSGGSNQPDRLTGSPIHVGHPDGSTGVTA